MSRQKTEKLHDFLVLKDMSYAVRLTSYAHGQNKKYFMFDCIQREWNESKLVNHILEVYYSIASNRPTIADEEVKHFRNILMERIKFEDDKSKSQESLDFPEGQ